MPSRRPLIDTVVTLLTDHYVFPDVAEEIAAVLRGNDHDHLADDAEFANAVTTDLQSVNGTGSVRACSSPSPTGA